MGLPDAGMAAEAMDAEERVRARRLLQDCRTGRRLSHDDEVLLGRLVLDGRCAEACRPAVDDPAEADMLRLRVSDGREAARQLELHCLGLVAHVARQYRGRGVDLEDLVQEGWFGIRRAVELWDYRRGFRLSTYAAWWVRQAVQRAVSRQSRAIRLPRPVTRKVHEVVVARDALLVESGTAPISLIAQRTGFDVAQVGTLLQLASPPVPLDPTTGGAPTIEVHEQIEREELAAAINHALARLGSREREVVRRRFGFCSDVGETLECIGSDIGVTRERIRQIESTALQKLRKNHDLRARR